MARSNGMLGPWEAYRKVQLGLVFALAIFLFVVILLPGGFAALLVLVGAAYCWKPIGVTNPMLGTYTINTPPYKVAAFFMTLKYNLKTVINPVVSVGFGPPTPDPDHGLEPGWSPFRRLSSYWTVLAGVVLAAPEVFLTSAHYPAWGGPTIPGIILYPFSVVGWHVTLQVVLAIFRIQGTHGSTGAVEPKPATMIGRSSADIPMQELMRRSVTYGAGPTVVFLLLWAVVRWPFLITLLVAPMLLFGVAAVSASRILARAYITGWNQRNERREYWGNVFMYLRDKTPTLANEAELPTFEEYEQSIDPNDEDPPPYVPEVKVATFIFPPNCVFDDYIGQEDRIRGLIGFDCAISPIGNFTASGQEVGGTIGASGFRVWWSEQEMPNLLDPDVNHWMRELLCRSIVIPALGSVRGIGYCTMLSCGMITRKDSPRQLLEVKVIPGPGVSLEAFLNKIPEIQTVLGVPWVRVGRVGGRNGTSAITLYIGQYPAQDQVKFINPMSIVRKQIDQMDWAYYFNSQNLAGTTGVPKLVTRKPTTKLVDKLVFELPDGLSYEAVESRLSPLKSTSGNEFMEIEPGAEVDTRRMGMVERAQAESQQQSKFTIIAAKNDPLKRVFDFGEYRDKILTGRVPGEASMQWSPGVLADDTLAVYKFDDELPHMLLAGASGMGKSVVANSMIIQMAYNNAPTELRFWMIEPKNEMQVYQDIDVVERFVDSWTPDKHFMSNAADLMEDAVNEMNRRYEVMKDHPKFPKKLEKAREIAKRESEANGTDIEDHPLYMPFIVLIVEECATLFADAADKEERNEQGRLLAATAEIARKARAAGIYLICITQYPTNVSIPSVIRNQMRRVGLGCQNSVASNVVIGESGLERIKVKGMGKVSVKGTFRTFRGYWVKDGDPDEGEPNDVLDVVKQLPGGSKNWSAGGAHVPEQVIPDISEMVYNIWDQSPTASVVRREVGAAESA